MDSVGQLHYFLLAAAVGFVGGIAYEPFSFLRLLAGCRQGKRKGFAVFFDLLFWVVFALIGVLAEYLLRFPDFRGYIWAGYAIGGIIYLKILHRIVAFLENLCYNKITESIKKAKKKDKTLKKRDKTVFI